MSSNITPASKLSEIRKMRGLTQKQVASRMGVGQARVSSIERTGLEHLWLSTLYTYITALGGTLEISVTYNDRRITLPVRDWTLPAKDWPSETD